MDGTPGWYLGRNHSYHILLKEKRKEKKYGKLLQWHKKKWVVPVTGAHDRCPQHNVFLNK